jgi:hypothetical protein
VERKGVIVLFGDPGGGKTTAALESFSGALVYSTGLNSSQFFMSQRERDPEYAKAHPPPAREVVVDMFSNDGNITTDAEGMPLRLHHKMTFEHYLRALIKRATQDRNEKKPLTYRNLVVDEIGTLYQRVYEDVLPTALNKSGKPDPLGAWNLLLKWAMEIQGYYRYLNTLGLNVVLVAHNTDPDGEKKGGPKMPSQGVQKLVTQESDMVLQRIVRDPVVAVDLENATAAKKGPRRLWTAFASERWNAKNRGLPDSMLETVADWPLSEIVRYAGIDP